MILSGIKRISKNSFWFALGTILTQAMGFFLLPLYTRYLTPADYGIISIAVVITSILTILCIFGMRGAISRFYYDYNHDKTELREYISTICITVFSVSFGLTILLYLFGDCIFSMLIPEIPFHPYLTIVLWTTLLSIPLNFAFILLQVRERSITYSLINVVKFLLMTAAIIIFVVLFREGALGSLKGQLIVTAVFCFVGLALLKKDIGLSFNPKKLHDSLAYGLPMIPHELAGWTSSLIDRIFLAGYTSLATVGLYSLGYWFGSILSFIAISINFAWVPFFFSTAKEKGIKESGPIFARLTSYYIVFLLFMALCITFFSENVILLMTTPEYYGATTVVPYIVLVFVFNGMYYMVVNQLFFLKKTGFVSFSTLTAAILNIGLNVFLIPRYDMIGAAIAAIISYAYTFVLVYYFSQKHFPISYDYIRIGKTFALALGIFLIALALPQLDMFYDIASKCLLIGGYLVGIIILGIITQEEWQYVKHLLLCRDFFKIG